jgi:hypothetical protein
MYCIHTVLLSMHYTNEENKDSHCTLNCFLTLRVKSFQQHACFIMLILPNQLHLPSNHDRAVACHQSAAAVAAAPLLHIYAADERSTLAALFG